MKLRSIFDRMKKQRLTDTNFEFHLDDRGFYYLRLKEGEEFNMKDIKNINLFILENRDSFQKPFLIEFGYGSTISDGVQEHLTNSANRFSTADAILISTYAHQLIAKFYIRHYKPTKPTKIFESIFEALEWIEKQG
ncbi:hypothetical protein G3O08_05380 [Cryomorpha ignava]|uniref:DUF7793 domain-containing protein n=2 Tax=Cryomorpha ignava TaxID=101383 RepID=A0A7K3WMQ7_9FLAO|nr:hypothetical protein [Cryomorpha ignava]